ncbi:MAG: HK97 family phage prohead protease [Chitinophagales bacterium]|nr:HK97 family phage prohead protease [Chitinophagales bacterium]
MAKFVLSDENILNSYGFRVHTGGIGMKRFKANPVMLSEHWNSVHSVLGKWINITKDENGRLTADTDFDPDDEDAQKIAGKVDRGYIKGASIGISFNPDDMAKQEDGTYLLKKCELMEASICAIPSNAGALKLYAENGELMDESQIKLAIKDVKTNQITNIQNKNMKKVILTLSALMALDLQSQNTAEGVDVDAVNAGIDKLKAELDRQLTALSSLQEVNKNLSIKIQDAQKEKIAALVDEAILNGKISATEKEEWSELASTNYELAVKTLGSIAGKKSLGGQVGNPKGNPKEVKTVDEFAALSIDEQLTFKAENPEAYKRLFG